MARYGDGMIDAVVTRNDADSLEAVIRHDLARGDAMAGTVVPILRHLLANDDSSLFGDEIIARVRGMTTDVASQLLDNLKSEGEGVERFEHDPAELASLGDTIIANSAFLTHVHGLALEWQLTERLQARIGLDPVLPPLLQALIAARDESIATIAMNFLTAQARFCQAQRRMRLPLSELPGDLLHAAIVAMRTIAEASSDSEAKARAAEQRIRGSFDESRTRLGLVSRLVSGMGGGAIAALSASHAGVATFLTALAMGAGQDRDAVALSTNESQCIRLALSLRCAGVKPAAIEEQFVLLHPEATLPEGFGSLGPDRAAAILSFGNYYPGE
ncbi:hypothetical protein GCM10011371_06220 [Novosphingobium marinum]|nr:hypothetical protein GCM10011371_06220 [Novosphingobium marinum]